MIPLTQEPSDFANAPAELCTFCRVPTRWWHLRTNNPVCRTCAPNHRVRELHNYRARTV